MAPNRLAPVFSFKSKTSRARIVVFSFVAMFALILAACGGSQNPASQTTPAGKKHVLTVLANPGKAFTANFNPFNSTSDTIWGTQGLIYETLVYVNQKDGTATPWLASIPDVSADGLSMTFHITPNVKWSDGQPFTSDDVLFTFQSMQQNPDTLDKVNSLFKNYDRQRLCT
jgi:peptide/nickel transport system substrate-binding protein